MKETSAVKKYRRSKHLYSPKLYNEICFLHESVIPHNISLNCLKCTVSMYWIWRKLSHQHLILQNTMWVFVTICKLNVSIQTKVTSSVRVDYVNTIQL